MQRYAAGRVGYTHETEIDQESKAAKDDRELVRLKGISTVRSSHELGRFSDHEHIEDIPTLDSQNSKAMAGKMNEVIKPLEWEDLRFPTKKESLDFLKRKLPILSWVPMTTKETFRADVVAGFTILVMVVPQGMSYANIVGIPLVYGLYSTMVPCLVYAALGGCRQGAVGPTALVAILTNAAIDGLLTEEECPAFFDGSQSGAQSEVCPEELAKLASLTAFITGILQIGGSIFQLGFIVQFMAQPVVSGFTSAAAFLIALTQVRNVLGFSIERSQFIYVTVGEISKNIHKTNPINAVLGFSFFFMLRSTSSIAKKYKYFAWLRPLAPLIMCVLGSVIVYAANLDTEHGVEVVGDVPSGLPPFSAPDVSDVGRVIAPSITIVVLSYLVASANAKTLAALNNYEVDAGQELFALGFINFIGSLFSGFPSTISFSRAAVANSVGAKTQLFGAVTGLGMILALVLLTPVFAYLPNFVLGSIVMSSVVNLVAYEDAIELWRTKKSDCLLWFLAFLGTLFLGILNGVLLAVSISLILVIYESVRPQVSLIWRVKGTTTFRSIKQAPNGEWVKSILIVRFGAPMYFANMAYIRDTLYAMIKKGNPEEIRYLILEMSPVISMDSSALHILEDMAKDFDTRGLQLCFANTGSRVFKLFTKAGFVQKLGEDWFQPSTAGAVSQCLIHQKMGHASGNVVNGVHIANPDDDGEEETKDTSV
mmetsp:Transcript_8848/g.12184  ORF Transcript_8848/g.12184 Transcript_8848/m.12184 type:complete len:709 (+) Transcript_8848:85-2211(+)